MSARNRRNRRYTYRLTTRGIDYIKNSSTQTVTQIATFGDDWSLYRRHDTKHSPWTFELWINGTAFVDRWTASAIRRWRKMGYIVPHADTFLAKRERCERAISTIEEEQ